jgi:hypothetical protein
MTIYDVICAITYWMMMIVFIIAMIVLYYVVMNVFRINCKMYDPDKCIECGQDAIHGSRHCDKHCLLGKTTYCNHRWDYLEYIRGGPCSWCPEEMKHSYNSQGAMWACVECDIDLCWECYEKISIIKYDD